MTVKTSSAKRGVIDRKIAGGMIGETDAKTSALVAVVDAFKVNVGVIG